jgi:starch phosphorylase
MKVLVNGGINLSELDGWWAEAYTPAVGWALGDGKDHGDDPSWDAAEASALYGLLEREVIPEFYNRNPRGIPIAWVTRMRESMARLTPLFSANRTVREYTDRYYIPAAATYRERSADKGAEAVKLADWHRSLERNWSNVRFSEVKTTTDGGMHLFEVQVYLGSLNPDSVRVELYADEKGGDAVRLEMTRGARLAGAANGYAYSGHLPVTRPVSDFTARLIPYRHGVAVPLEEATILWQR